MMILPASERRPAPPFELPDQRGQTVRLSDFRGRAVVLFFYPKAFTAVCTQQTVCFQENLSALVAKGAQLLGVSRDAPATQQRFGEQYGVEFPLLSDVDGQVVRAYGVARHLLRVSKRVTFVIDAQGRIAARLHHELRYRKHIDQALVVLGELAQG